MFNIPHYKKANRLDLVIYIPLLQHQGLELDALYRIRNRLISFATEEAIKYEEENFNHQYYGGIVTHLHNRVFGKLRARLFPVSPPLNINFKHLESKKSPLINQLFEWQEMELQKLFAGVVFLLENRKDDNLLTSYYYDFHYMNRYYDTSAALVRTIPDLVRPIKRRKHHLTREQAKHFETLVRPCNSTQ